MKSWERHHQHELTPGFSPGLELQASLKALAFADYVLNYSPSVESDFKHASGYYDPERERAEMAEERAWREKNKEFLMYGGDDLGDPDYYHPINQETFGVSGKERHMQQLRAKRESGD